MSTTLIYLANACSLLFLLMALLGTLREGRLQHLIFRMLPFARPPGTDDLRLMALSGAGGSVAETIRRSRPLWTLRECQLELLTESEMHAFEANAKPYCPERRASNLPPRKTSKQIALYRAEGQYGFQTSRLLRTLERRAEIPETDAAASFRWKPLMMGGSENTLSYTYQGSLNPNEGVN